MTPQDKKRVEKTLYFIQDISCTAATKLYKAARWTCSKIYMLWCIGKMLLPCVIMGASGFEKEDK